MDSATKPRILIVEDDPDLQLILTYQLESDGYVIDKAGNGEEAFRHIQDSVPDCILLDIMMPVMDGFSFLKRLRSVDRTLEVPVIILTASEDRRTPRKSTQYLADAFMKKPYDLTALSAKISELIAASRSASTN
ncbi:MAG: response regulator [bacterium]